MVRTFRKSSIKDLESSSSLSQLSLSVLPLPLLVLVLVLVLLPLAQQPLVRIRGRGGIYVILLHRASHNCVRKKAGESRYGLSSPTCKSHVDPSSFSLNPTVDVDVSRTTTRTVF